MRWLLATAFTVLVVLQSRAQIGNGYRENFVNSVWAVKWAPLKLLEPQTSLHFGVEHRILEQFSLQAEAGITPNFMQLNIFRDEAVITGDPLYQKINGFQVRLEPRFYIFKSSRAYIATEFSYRYYRITEDQAFGFDCLDGNCSYFEKFEIRSNKNVWTVYAKLGRQRVFNRIFVLDYYAGLGVRGQTIIQLDPPPPGGEPVRWDLGSFNRAGTYAFPSVTVGARIGINLQ